MPKQTVAICSCAVLFLLSVVVLVASVPAAPQESERVHSIAPPTTPLPPEAQSSAITRFSFIAYGDTRGRRDGVAVQYEHSLIVDSMLAQIKRLQSTDYPVRFIIQSGDAVVHGQNAKEWNVSFIPLIDRLTTEGGVPYFLAPGNHDVSGATTVSAPERQPGLHNYLDAVSQLIPPDGSLRRLSAIQPIRSDTATPSWSASTPISRETKSNSNG